MKNPPSKGWVERTPEDFQSAAKARQKFTHPKMLEDMAGKDSKLGQEDDDEFKKGIDPLLEAGMFGCLLFQFPPSFKAEEPSREKLEGFLVRFRDYPSSSNCVTGLGATGKKKSETSRTA